MTSEIRLSVIIPAYNPGKKIIPCLVELLKNLEYLSKYTNLIYEILIINDGGDKIDLNFIENDKKIKLINLRKNKGVGHARQFGLKVSEYDYLFYLDSDVVMENQNTLKVLFEDFLSNKQFGSIGPVMSYHNLNKAYSSNFVAAKSCYGYDQEDLLIEFSGMRSECGLIEKNFLKSIGGWSFIPGAGGEEFVLGHRIIKAGKKNIVTKNTNYSTFYDNLYNRCKKIISRTSAYLPIFMNRKKFESRGAFATFNQSLSTLITSLLILIIFLSIFINELNILVPILLMINLLIELTFLRFCMKHYSKLDLPIYILGIFVINISIVIGVLLGIYKLSFALKKIRNKNYI